MSLLAGIEAVSFDVGGTLIEPWPSVGHVYASVAARHGLVADPDQLNGRFAAAWRARAEFSYSRAAWSEIVSQTFYGIEPPLQPLSFFDELYQCFAARDAWRIYDDVIPVIDALLDAGMKLAIVSNWDERLRPLLDELKLSRYFDAIVISSEVGFHKPSAVIFAEAVKKLAVPSSAVLHIGDSVREDVTGALEAGLRAARLDRNTAAEHAAPFHSLTSLLALVA